MISYKAKTWLPAIWHFHTGPTAISLFKRLIVVAVYVIFITVMELYYLDLRLKDTPGTFLQAMGILLSLLLIFRTNTAYDRFYEGRTVWGGLVNNSRNLALFLQAVLPIERQDDRLFFTKMISSFPFALKNHLRGLPGSDELELVSEADAQMLAQQDHKPAGVASLIWSRTEVLYREGIISESQHINLNRYLTTMMDVTGVCERIRSTPIPFSYSLFIKVFIGLYVLVLPFTVIQALGYMTVPAVLMTSYILIGLEMIGVEIEDPFGVDRNDLPLNQISQLIRVNVHDILQFPLPNAEKEAARPGFVIVT